MDVRKWFRAFVVRTMIRSPFLGILLTRVPVYLAREGSYRGSPAVTDGRSIILFQDFIKLSDVMKSTVLIHEVSHIINKHPVRAEDLINKLFPTFNTLPEPARRHVLDLVNVFEDVEANRIFRYLEDIEYDTSRLLTDYHASMLGIEHPEKKSFERMVVEYLRSRVGKGGGRGCLKVPVNLPSGGGDTSNDFLDRVSEGGKGFRDIVSSSEGRELRRGAEKINEGDPDLENAGDGRELAEVVRRLVTNALVTAKTAGKLPAGLERLVSELVKPRVNWRVVLRKLITPYVGRDVINTYSRLSKKVWEVSDVLYPGRKRVGIHKVAVLVDTSGSISEKELTQFVSEIYSIFKDLQPEIEVVPWDAKAYKAITIRSYADIRNKLRRLPGGGGTVIKEALEEAIKEKADINIIFSDFEIFDLRTREVQELLRKLRNLILVSTYEEPPKIPGAVGVKVDLQT